MQKTTTPLLLFTALLLSVFALLRPNAGVALANTMSLKPDGAIAVVALPSLMNELMQSDRFLPDRQSYETELSEELQEMGEKLRDLSTRLNQMTPEDPGAQELYTQFQQLRQQFGELQAENSRKVEAFTAKQIKECNELVRSSAKAVAEELGFEYVIASADPDEGLSDQSVELLLRQLTARPMIRFPEDNDITSDVRDDLNLE